MDGRGAVQLARDEGSGRDGIDAAAALIKD